MKKLDIFDVVLYGLWLGSAMIAIDYFLIPGGIY
jgi:hypothetical protein|tara:strand:+ start:642 stop:743 length:102 start_codon:yes stop_codon:yes gene_type:complete